ncbi:MAG: transposase [Campylobacterota bacterium]|nr:transposase [Campylobacterota bacterium]
MSRERRTFDRDFKINAVLLVQRGGSTMKQISKDLGINYQMLAEWKKEYEKKGDLAFPGNGKQLYLTEFEKEILELKRRLRKAEMERDILKKAMAISLKEK